MFTQFDVSNCVVRIFVQYIICPQQRLEEALTMDTSAIPTVRRYLLACPTSCPCVFEKNSKAVRKYKAYKTRFPHLQVVETLNYHIVIFHLIHLMEFTNRPPQLLNPMYLIWWL